MLVQALQAEVDAYIAQFADERDEHGHRLVVRNGYHESRKVLTDLSSRSFAPAPLSSTAHSSNDPANTLYHQQPKRS